MIAQLDLSGISSHLSREETCASIFAHEDDLLAVLHGQVGTTKDLGWFYPDRWENSTLLNQILSLAEKIRSEAELFVLVGIGGSNRGAQAVVESLGDRQVEIIYSGDTLSTHALNEVLNRIDGRSTYINVIAKDFNTLEPGITFRILRQALEHTYGKAAAKRIVVTGSHGKGQLIPLGQRHGYTVLPFPEDMGGRFSVISAVGLLPMAVAGVDIQALIRGAITAKAELESTPLVENPACLYAVSRNLLSEKGFLIESLINFEPPLAYFCRWWSQLFGESEGKDRRGIFPTTSNYSEDLHAIGQYIQEGKRVVMETFLDLHYSLPDRLIHQDAVDDGFDYLTNKTFQSLNKAVYEAAYLAHTDAGVPCFQIHAAEINPAIFGELFYFFMLSCCLSSVFMGVNPYGQPGVEAYKQFMYKLLGKRNE